MARTYVPNVGFKLSGTDTFHICFQAQKAFTQFLVRKTKFTIRCLRQKTAWLHLRKDAQNATNINGLNTPLILSNLSLIRAIASITLLILQLASHHVFA